MKALATHHKSQAFGVLGVSTNCFPGKRPQKGGAREVQTFSTSPDPRYTVGGGLCPQRGRLSGMEAGHRRQPPTPDHQRARTCHPPPPGRADTAASDPTSRGAQLLGTTKQNKGAQRGRSHSAFQSPSAPAPRPEPSCRSSPASPLAADQGPGSSGPLSARGRR